MDKSEFNKRLGLLIRKNRIEKGLTQLELAGKMNIDFQYISRIERGLISPTLYWVLELAKAMDCSELEFLSGFLLFKKDFKK